MTPALLTLILTVASQLLPALGTGLRSLRDAQEEGETDTERVQRKLLKASRALARASAGRVRPSAHPKVARRMRALLRMGVEAPRHQHPEVQRILDYTERALFPALQQEHHLPHDRVLALLELRVWAVLGFGDIQKARNAAVLDWTRLVAQYPPQEALVRFLIAWSR